MRPSKSSLPGLAGGPSAKLNSSEHPLPEDSLPMALRDPVQATFTVDTRIRRAAAVLAQRNAAVRGAHRSAQWARSRRTHMGEPIGVTHAVSERRPVLASRASATTASPFWFAASKNRPLRSRVIWRVVAPCVFACCIRISCPLAGSIANTAMLSWPRFAT